MLLNDIHIGTSGWSYKHWKESFYPKGTKPADYISYYAQHFSTAEINSTFYHLPRLSTVENWILKVPAGFKFCLKMSRYLTQVKRLVKPEDTLQRFFTAIEPLQQACGLILFQLPATLQFDYDTAAHLFYTLRNHYNVYSFALEVRHPSWLHLNSLNLLTKYNIAFVIAHSDNKFPYAEVVTNKNIYVRFHGPEALYASSYSAETLQYYAAKFLQWQSEGHVVWVYFNNDINGHAVANATSLLTWLQQALK